MKIRTILGIAVAFLVAWGPAFAAGDDLESLIDDTAASLGKPDDAAVKDSLRLAAAQAQMAQMKFELDPALSGPTTVASTTTHGFEGEVIRPEGPFALESVKQSLQAAEVTEMQGLNPDVIAQRQANLKRWKEIAAQVEARLDTVVVLRAHQEDENPFDLYSIDSFAKLDKFVSDFKAKQSADQQAAIDKFMKKVAGQVQDAAAGVPHWDGDWNTTALGKLHLQVLGNTVIGHYEPLIGESGLLAGTLSDDGKKIPGIWRQHAFSAAPGGADAIGEDANRFEIVWDADGKGFRGKYWPLRSGAVDPTSVQTVTATKKSS